MDLGDIVLLNEVRLLVVHIDEEGKATLSNASGDLSHCDSSIEGQVVCNPTREWPFVQLPARPPRGRVTSVARPILYGESFTLTYFEDWIVGEPLRTGGALYLRPTLGFKHMERVLIVFERGQTSVVIPKNFWSVHTKAAAAKFARVDTGPEPLTVYDHLVGNGLGEDE